MDSNSPQGSQKAGSVPLSIVVMTFNEEGNVGACLDSVATWANEIFVVDSFSGDGTEKIARTYPIHFIQHAYTSHPEQWDWALRNLPFKNEWIFALDADFRVSPELRSALARELPAIPDDIAGLYVRHRQLFQGRFIRHGTMYPRYWLRLFRRAAVSVDAEDLVDLHFYVRGEIKRIEYDIVEDNVKERDLSFWISKQLRFAERAAVEELRRRRTGNPSPIPPAFWGTPDQRTLWLKERWYRFPLFWRPALYFLYRYFLRLGFLDGKEGFLYHFTQALLYRVAVDSYIDDFLKKELTQEQLVYRLRPLGPVPAVAEQRNPG